MLTLFIEVGGTIILLDDIFESSLAGIICFNFIASWDGCFVAYIMYLMLSHNDDEYFKLIKLMDKLKICICFRCFINQGLSYLEKSSSETVDLHQDTVTDKTCTIDVTFPDHTLPKELQAQYSRHSHI